MNVAELSLCAQTFTQLLWTMMLRFCRDELGIRTPLTLSCLEPVHVLEA